MPQISIITSPFLLPFLSKSPSLNPIITITNFISNTYTHIFFNSLTAPFSRNILRSSSSSSNMSSQFSLSPTSTLKIQKGDITRWFINASSDAIVNPANERMLGGGGADGAIHDASGPELRTACYDVPEVRRGVRCPTGEARITPGFKLPASHVIHTVGPVYDGDSNVATLLSNAYRNSLRVARENNIQYVAFPAISCGIFGYPFDEAATVAISTIKDHCSDIKEVHFVLFADDIYNVWVKKAEELLPK